MHHFVYSAIFLSSCALASEITYQCPSMIDTEQKIKSKVGEWQEINSLSKSNFLYVNYYSTRPHAEKSIRTTGFPPPASTILRAELINGKAVMKSNGKSSLWIACVYHGTNIGVTVEVKNVKQCVNNKSRVTCTV